MRIVTVVFYTAFVLAVTWPGMIPFNRIEPLVLGLPFSFAWVVMWVVGSLIVLLALDRVEGRERED